MELIYDYCITILLVIRHLPIAEAFKESVQKVSMSMSTTSHRSSRGKAPNQYKCCEKMLRNWTCKQRRICRGSSWTPSCPVDATKSPHKYLGKQEL
eukprot:scaffold1912_cov160-Skeletonema_dohrnii-CCMP3373.AAC.3